MTVCNTSLKNNSRNIIVSSLQNCSAEIARGRQIWWTRGPVGPSCPGLVRGEPLQFPVPRREALPVCAHKAGVAVATWTTTKNGDTTGTHRNTHSPHINMSLSNSLKLFLPSVMRTDKPADQPPVHMKVVFSGFLSIFLCVFLPCSPWSPSFPIYSSSLKHPIKNFEHFHTSLETSHNNFYTVHRFSSPLHPLVNPVPLWAVIPF